MSTATARSCARTTRGGERGWKAKRRVKASGERMSTRVKNDDVVVCTGGLGFIGSHLCEVLVTRARVVAVDSMDARGPYPERHKRANARRLEALGVEVREMDVASDATAFEALVRDLGGVDDEESRSRTWRRGQESVRRTRIRRARLGRTSRRRRWSCERRRARASLEWF